ncbi:MAG: hypothetical protein IJE76_02485 [Bacteroidales bacterium]|nr:hypothetical protein [Bacteroidales bacterium]
MQTIIAYTIIGVAVGYTVYSVVRLLSHVDTDADTDIKCGASCGSCPMKNIKKCSKNYYKYNLRSHTNES